MLWKRHAKPVSAIWLAWPTLTEAPGGREVSGVTHYAADAEKVLRRWGDLVMAELVVELRGTYVGAVSVVIDGVKVGHIPHDVSPRYRGVIEEMNTAAVRATCRVEAESGELAPWFRVLGRPAACSPGAPFLPPTWGDYVTLTGGQREQLDASLNSRAKVKNVVRTATLTRERSGLGVSLDGTRVGTVAGEFPLLRVAEKAGYPLTCRSELRRDPEHGFRLQAFATR